MWSHKLIWKCTCLLKTVWKSLISDNVVAGLAKIFEIHPSNYRQRCWHVLFFGTWLRCFQAHLSVNISGGLSSCKYNFCITLIQYTVSPIMRVFHTLKKKNKKWWAENCEEAPFLQSVNSFSFSSKGILWYPAVSGWILTVLYICYLKHKRQSIYIIN